MSDIRDHIFDDIYRAFHKDTERKLQRSYIGSALKRLWRAMDNDEWRERFVSWAIKDLDERKTPPAPRFFPDLRDDDLEHVAHWWKRVMEDLPTDDNEIQGMAMNFARCVRTGKSPSGKIIAFAKRYFRDWKATQSVEEYGVFESE